MRYLVIAFWMLFASITAAEAQVTVGIGVPGVSIGINFPVYPQLVAVPGYPVYYAPQADSNYFFYDGMYWVYQQDNWYASSWYNGPWQLVNNEVVPLYVLRVPVRYYRRPPVYFNGWSSDAPPRWGDHWGNSWQQQHTGWDNWNHNSMPAIAPLPTYQRQYSGSRYPQAQQQQQLQSQNYRYQPKDAEVQQRYQAQQTQGAPAAQPRPDKSAPAQGYSRPPSLQQANPATPNNPAPPRAGGDTQRPVTTNAPAERSGAAAQPPRAKPQQDQAAQRQPGQPQGKAPTKETNAQHQPTQPQGKAPTKETNAQHQPTQGPQAAAPRQSQAPKAQGQDKPAQGKAPAQAQKPERQPGQPQAAQHQQQPAKAQVNAKPEGKPATESKEKNEPQGGDRGK